MNLFGFILYGILCGSSSWMSVSFPRLGKFTAIMSSNTFSASLSVSSSFGTSLMQKVPCLMLSQSSLPWSLLIVFIYLFILLKLGDLYYCLAVEKGRGRPAPLLQTIPWADQSGRQSMRERGVETGSWKPIHLWGPGVTEPLDGGEPHQLMESRGHQAARQQG